MRLASMKLPVKCKFIVREGYTDPVLGKQAAAVDAEDVGGEAV